MLYVPLNSFSVMSGLCELYQYQAEDQQHKLYERKNLIMLYVMYYTTSFFFFFLQKWIKSN